MSNTLKDGGPVCPVAVCNQGLDEMKVMGHAIKPGGNAQFMGVSLREHYAGLAMQAMMSNPTMMSSFGRFAVSAFEMADAMIAENERKAREGDKAEKAGDGPSIDTADILDALVKLYMHTLKIDSSHAGVSPEHPLNVAKRAIDRAAGRG